jgi:hypothetical protein
MELTPEIREAAKREAAEEQARGRMSDQDIAKLRVVSYEDKLRKQGEEKFATALTQIEPTPENLSKLIERCATRKKVDEPIKHLARRTAKLLYWIQARGFRLGHEIRLPSDINLLSELVAYRDPQADEPYELNEVEADMPEAVWAKQWKVKKVVPPKQDGPEPRYCSLGRKCLKAVKGKAAIVLGRSDYCSSVCRGRAKVIAKRTPGASILVH